MLNNYLEAAGRAGGENGVGVIVQNTALFL